MMYTTTKLDLSMFYSWGSISTTEEAQEGRLLELCGCQSCLSAFTIPQVGFNMMDRDEVLLAVGVYRHTGEKEERSYNQFCETGSSLVPWLSHLHSYSTRSSTPHRIREQ
jgi:hypothetical protein